MTNEEADRKLKNSLASLKERQGKLSISDLEAEVINLACLEILRKRQRQDFSTGKGLLDINVFAMHEYVKQESKDAEAVTLALAGAANRITSRYDTSYAMNAVVAVQQNCSWDGMWDFLKEYFQEKHGIQIDGEEAQDIEDDAPPLRGKKENIKELAQQILDQNKESYSVPEMSIIIQSQYYTIEDLFTYGANLQSENPDDHIEVADAILGICKAFFSNLDLIPKMIGWEGQDQQISRVTGIQDEVGKVRELHVAVKAYHAFPSPENRAKIMRLMNT